MSVKAKAKMATRSTKSSKPAIRGKKATKTSKSSKSMSLWSPRTHQRVKSDRKSAILCQRNSKSKIWKRDLVSVPPGNVRKVDCGRCLIAINAN